MEYVAKGAPFRIAIAIASLYAAANRERRSASMGALHLSTRELLRLFGSVGATCSSSKEGSNDATGSSSTSCSIKWSTNAYSAAMEVEQLSSYCHAHLAKAQCFRGSCTAMSSRKASAHGTPVSSRSHGTVGDERSMSATISSAASSSQRGSGDFFHAF